MSHAAMTTPAKRFRELIEKRGVTTKDVAHAAGITLRSLHNICCGSSKSRVARQKVSNFLAATIWPDIPSETVILTMPVDSEIADLTADQAMEIHQTFPDTTSIIEGAVRFIRSTAVLFDFRHARPPQGKSPGQD